MIFFSDVDPDPVGSAFIWIQRSQLKEKQNLTNKYLGLISQEIICFNPEPKKAANL